MVEDRREAGARVVRIAAAAYEAMRERACLAGEEECCGALVGRPVIDRIVPLANAASDRRSAYAISPRDLFELERRVEVSGFFHSHPDGTAEPSEHDLVLAWPGYIYVIIGRQVRAWQLDPDGSAFRELAVQVG